MNSGENISPNDSLRQELKELTRRFREETRFLSVGADKNESFQLIVDHGEKALPILLEDFMADESGGWWRLQAIWTIAHDIGKTIEYPENILDSFDLVKESTREWACQQGYLSRDDI